MKPVKWHRSCAIDGYNTSWKEPPSEQDHLDFREYLEFRDSMGFRQIRATGEELSREDIERARDELYRARHIMRLDHKLSPRDNRRFHASQRRYNSAMAGVRLLEEESTSYSERPSRAKRRKVAEDRCEAFKMYRQRILDFLARHIHGHTVPTLLRELPTTRYFVRTTRHISKTQTVTSMAWSKR
jgi:hypothetical protein